MIVNYGIYSMFMGVFMLIKVWKSSCRFESDHRHQTSILASSGPFNPSKIDKRFAKFKIKPVTHSQIYLAQAAQIAQQLDHQLMERMAEELAALRERGGRLFLLGVGGSAGNCSHAVNDFRKLAGIEAYSPCDNVSELTARTNDEGWATVFEAWLKVSRANAKDAVFVLSVGGGDAVRKVSANIVYGLQEAKQRGLKILGIVGRDGGYTKQIGDEVV